MSSITIIPPPEVIEWLTSLNLGNIILETTMPTQKGDNEIGNQQCAYHVGNNIIRCYPSVADYDLGYYRGNGKEHDSHCQKP